MDSKITFLLCFQCAFLLIGVSGQTSGVGIIFIGNQGNRSDPTEYVFNGNYPINSTAQQIPFSAVVLNGGTEVNKNDVIDVTCVNEFEDLSGYLQVDFATVNLPPADNGGNITWSFRSPVTSIGRAAVVRCYGQSVGSTCPPSGLTGQTLPQFCPETSLSDPITIVRTPPPVVSICERVNHVSRFTTNTYTASFQLELSEAVRGSNVTVTCRQELPQDLQYCQQQGVTCCTPNHNIAVTTTTVYVGETTATMPYTVTRTGPGNTCIGVRCSAQSVGALPEGYLQYIAVASQQGVSSEGLFQTTTPQVFMEPQFLTVYNTSFQSLLYLDAKMDVPVEFQCQASVATTLQEALDKTLPANIDCTFNITTVAPPTTVTPIITTTVGNSTVVPPTPPIDPSSPWITVDSSFTITVEDKHQMVRTRRQQVAIAEVQELVVTTCCSTADASSPYTDLKVASVTVVNLTPHMNSTGGVTIGDVNPAYREVAPCPCDLTYQACDVNCCCDGECTDDEKETFSCIQGRPGGLDPGPDPHRCSSSHFPRDDWFPLMCVEFESNAFLGMFYANTNTTAGVNIGSHVYTYRREETGLEVSTGYREGSPVLTISSSEVWGDLPLPSYTAAGYCLDNTPVHFLRDTSATCTRPLTQATCADLTLFSARSFVESSWLYSPACPRSFSVSSTGGSTGQPVSVQVNYHCSPTANNAAYVKTSTASSFSDLVSPNTVYSLDPGLETANCTDACGANNVCLSYNQDREEVGRASLPSRCSYDNSFDLPPVPSYNAATQTCDNVVLEVRYNISWAGQTITGLNADVVLGSVSVTAGQAVSVSQRFSALFTHDYTGPSNQSDNYLGTDAQYTRAGRPGYDFGKPVASGCQSTNTTTGISTVDQSTISQMAVFSPGTDGLCQNARRRFLTFGDNMQASCVLRLVYNNVSACDSLKTAVLNQLNVLMPSSVLGRFGYNNPSISDMWITVLREDPYSSTNLDTTTTPSPTPTLDPNTNITVTTTEDPMMAENMTFDPLSVRGGVCRNIVSGIHLEIMYAETAYNYLYPVREIVGAAIRYTVSNWSMSCVGGQSGRCEAGSSLTQPFLLTSSVQYTKVPPTIPQQPILFYKIHDKETCQTDTCYRFFQDFDTSVCYFDTCWHELFYPIMASYQGSEGVKYTRGFSLLFLLFILGYVSVTKPWK